MASRRTVCVWGLLKLGDTQAENLIGNTKRTEEEMWVVICLISYFSRIDTVGVGMGKKLGSTVRLTC